MLSFIISLGLAALVAIIIFGVTWFFKLLLQSYSLENSYEMHRIALYYHVIVLIFFLEFLRIALRVEYFPAIFGTIYLFFLQIQDCIRDLKKLPEHYT